MPGQSILIHDALIVSDTEGDGRPFHGWVRVEGRRIVAVSRGSPPSDEPADRIIDGARHALIPGLVNAHAHSHSSLTRGSAEGLPLADWLRLIEREQAQLTDEQAYSGALSTYCEALLSGTTLIVDMCLRPEPALQAAREIGIRAVIVPYVADTKPFTLSLQQVESLFAASDQDQRVQVWCGLHDLESCSDDQIRRGVTIAEQYDVGLHLHCSETQFSVQKTLQRTGRRPVAQLDYLGALGPRTMLAHCVWIDDSEQGLLADRGSHVVHNPHANLKLGSGIAPVPAMLASGVNVAAGTDGAKANNNLDMFDVMKFASLIHKGLHQDPSLVPPEVVLAMATRHGAQAAGVESGGVAPGMLADLTLVNLDRFHLQPATPDTIITNLVHAARGADVDTVIVGGRIVVEDGVVKRADQDAVRAAAEKAGHQLLRT